MNVAEQDDYKVWYDKRSLRDRHDNTVRIVDRNEVKLNIVFACKICINTELFVSSSVQFHALASLSATYAAPAGRNKLMELHSLDCFLAFQYRKEEYPQPSESLPSLDEILDKRATCTERGEEIDKWWKDE